MSDFHDISMTSITGDQVEFSTFADQAVLVVNVASRWGLTPQYAGLRTLHNEVDGLAVAGFPCNQFGNQEPGTDAEILEFATSKYDANFPLFSKIDVNGDNEAPLYSLLKAAQPGDGETSDIVWNFEKFLVGADGTVLARFGPQTTPEEVREALPALLG